MKLKINDVETNMKCRAALFLTLVALGCSAVSLPCRAANPADPKDTSAGKTAAANPSLLVSTQWLADHLSDPHLVIVHIGHDRGEYLAVHIPGARFLPMDKFVENKAPAPG